MNMKNLTERQNIVISYKTTHRQQHFLAQFMEHEQNVLSALASVS